MPQPRVQPAAAPERIGQARDYIEAMLVELADLAATSGQRRLATNLRIVALEAARAPEQA